MDCIIANCSLQDIAAEIAEMKISDANTMSNELVKPAEVTAE